MGSGKPKEFLHTEGAPGEKRHDFHTLLHPAQATEWNSLDHLPNASRDTAGHGVRLELGVESGKFFFGMTCVVWYE